MRLHAKKLRSTLQTATLLLGGASLVLVFYGAVRGDETLEGRLLPAHERGAIRWITLDAQALLSGATLPAHMNVIIEIPEGSKRLLRRELFGRSGERTRYWGYCFPQDIAKAETQRKRSFPGTLFLSESERAVRREKELKQRHSAFSVFRNLTEKELNEESVFRGRIRHEKEVFYPGERCFVTSESPLPVGIDDDEDSLNTSLERDFGSDPQNPDSDGDGIVDGLEAFGLGTHPMRRDSDGDGLIDGIEDRNRNGRREAGETDPMQLDSDRDGLCDGICKVNKGLQLSGEDKNLNGLYEPDQGEYDPLKVDSDGDGILDDQEYYTCFLAGGDNC